VAPDRDVEALVDELRPDLMVLSYVQHARIRPFWVAASRREIPMLGIVGSWDRPTTKGPMPPGMRRYVALNGIMRREMSTYHGIAEDRIEVIGWPQMDHYHDASVRSREAFLESLGAPQGNRMILYAANSPRLGSHEPELVEHLARAVVDGAYGPQVTLLVRPHPKDEGWRARFAASEDPPRVILDPPAWGNLRRLADTLHAADVVVSTQGSISLDAIAAGRCVVNVAFDGMTTVPAELSIRNWYELDHYRPVVESGGTRVVNGFDELDAAICDYLDNPEADAENRDVLRHELLDPFDGRAAERLVALIERNARSAVKRKGLP